MANIRRDQLRRTSPDGGLYIYNALAFSTLLSSQETDAHHSPNFRSSLAATLLIYPVFPSCQIGSGPSYSNHLPDLAFRNFPSHQHTGPSEWCWHARQAPSRLATGGSPGPGPPCGVPSPSGQDEPYGSLRTFVKSFLDISSCPCRRRSNRLLNDLRRSRCAGAPTTQRHSGTVVSELRVEAEAEAVEQAQPGVAPALVPVRPRDATRGSPGSPPTAAAPAGRAAAWS